MDVALAEIRKAAAARAFVFADPESYRAGAEDALRAVEDVLADITTPAAPAAPQRRSGPPGS